MTIEGLAPTVRAVTIDEAIALIRRRPPVGGIEDVPVSKAVRRTLAEDVVASAPVPAHASSAMDGYAFRFADLPADRRLLVSGRVAAGHPMWRALPDGAAVRIFTGGVMPQGADTVALQETVQVDDRHVVLPSGLRAGDNCRGTGDDVVSGSTVLTAGTRLRPQDVGMAVGVGRSTLRVTRRIKVAVIATGDELYPPGTPLPPGCIHDTNRHTVGAALENLGVDVVDCGIVPDRRTAIRGMLLTAAATADLIITTGGVSVGDEDHVRSAVEEVGALDFWKLPLKPGRPVAVGDVGGVPFVGLPGNPVAALVTFWVIARPLALHLMGAAASEPARYPLTAQFRHRHSPGRRELLRARLVSSDDGVPRVETYTSTGSGILSSLTWSHGLVEIPEGAGDVEVGDLVSYIPYEGLDG
jgi:molybdopterin molybdotransferase